MTSSQRHPDAPSQKQLRYLRDLAMRRGESFTPPQTKAEASSEIRRLKRRRPLPIAERRREAEEARRGVGGTPGDDASYRVAEIEGFGSTAHWRLRG